MTYLFVVFFFESFIVITIQPPSNEVTSNESFSIDENTENDPFSLSTEIHNKQSTNQPKSTSSTNSNREYITSFTTTTTTTRKPHIDKGVQIIKELVEQARTTDQPDINRPIQSLTTSKSYTMIKERPVTTAKPKTISTLVPANHRPAWVSIILWFTVRQLLQFDAAVLQNS